VDFDSCVNCDAALIAASTICPQCGWLKDKPIESAEDLEIEPDTESPEVEFVSRLPCPAGVRMLGMAYIVFGLIMMVGSVIFCSLIVLVVISGGLSALGEIGDSSIAMPLPTGDVDPQMISLLDAINEISAINAITGPTMMFATSDIDMDVETMMSAIIGAFGIMIVGIIFGLIYLMFGRYLRRGNKWVRYLVIIFAIFSIPVFIPFVDEFDLSLLVSALISGLILYYLFKPHVRAYFAQPPIKKEKKSKKSKN
jgi:hypothetical protein